MHEKLYSNADKLQKQAEIIQQRAHEEYARAELIKHNKLLADNELKMKNRYEFNKAKIEEEVKKKLHEQILNSNEESRQMEFIRNKLAEEEFKRQIMINNKIYRKLTNEYKGLKAEYILLLKQIKHEKISLNHYTKLHDIHKKNHEFILSQPHINQHEFNKQLLNVNTNLISISNVLKEKQNIIAQHLLHKKKLKHKIRIIKNKIKIINAERMKNNIKVGGKKIKRSLALELKENKKSIEQKETHLKHKSDEIIQHKKEIKKKYN